MNADKAWPLLADPSRNEILQLLRGELVSQLQSLRSLTGRIQQLEQAIASYRGRLEDCKRIEAIPGIGRLSSTAPIAAIGGARTFRPGREMAAFLRLVPRQSGAGGRVQLLRTLELWIQTLLLRRPKNVAIVALARTA